MIEKGAYRKGGHPYCDQCNANLDDKGGVKFVAHMDAKASYTNVFKCTKCGNIITHEFERNSRDAQYWE